MTFSLEWNPADYPILSAEKERLSGERGAFRLVLLDAAERSLSRGEPQTPEQRMLTEILRIVKSGVVVSEGETPGNANELTESDLSKLNVILRGFE